jgi:hypothetical protein
MTDHPLIGRIIERIADGQAVGSPWAVLVRDDGTFTRSSLHPGSTTRVRAEPTSAAPGSGYATIATLRARVAELAAEIAGQRVELRPVDGWDGDGNHYEIERHGDRVLVRIYRESGTMVCARVRVADLLAALGLRGGL